MDVDKASVSLIRAPAHCGLTDQKIHRELSGGRCLFVCLFDVDVIFVITSSCDFLGTSIYGAPPPCLPRV